MTWPASRGCRIACPSAAWSHARRSRQASGMAPPARRSGRRPSRGPSLKRRSCSSAPILRATSIWPVERNNTARARPSRSWRLSSPGRSMTCGNGAWCSIATPFSKAKGGEQASLPPHGVTMGAAWPPCSAMMHCVRRRTLVSTEALGPDLARVIGRLLSLLSLGRKFLMVPVCCPAPEPQPNWRMETCSPSFA